MALSISKTNAMEFQRINALLHGDSGVGKTTSLGTLPADKTFVAGSERGLIPLRQSGFHATQLRSWDDCKELYAMFREPVVIDGDEIKIVAIDSLSAIAEFCKSHIINVDRKQITKERSGGKIDKPKGIHEDMMTMEDYGLLATRMSGLISAFTNLDIHVIFTCLSEWKEDKKTGAMKCVPMLSGKLAFQCPAYFDLVLHMENQKDEEGEGVRVWRTFNDDKITAKDASGVLDNFESPDWTTVFGKILKGGTK